MKESESDPKDESGMDEGMEDSGEESGSSSKACINSVVNAGGVCSQLAGMAVCVRAISECKAKTQGRQTACKSKNAREQLTVCKMQSKHETPKHVK
jgi:hypothetical protein